jgi:hypothetical protein
MAVKARILQVSSTKRTLEFTKKLIRPTTAGSSAGSILPDWRTPSSTPMAVASAYATSWTGVAPASCR